MEPLYLNIASGPYVLPGFINLDNSLFFRLAQLGPLVRPFISPAKREIMDKFVAARKVAALRRFNCKKRLAFGDNTVDHVLCSHFLEHLYAREAMFVLSQIHRVLRPDGTVHIILPDLRLQVLQYCDNLDPAAADSFFGQMLCYGEEGPSFRHRVLDINGAYGLRHLWMYDRNSISHRLRSSGFELTDAITTPSSEFRKDDGSLHVTARKV